MSVALPNAISPSYGTTSVVVNKPASLVNGDMALFIVGMKGTSNTVGTCGTPSGLTLWCSNIRKGSWATYAADEGNTSIYAFTREIVGGEGASYTFIGSSSDVMWGYSARLTKTLDDYDLDFVTADRTAAGTDGGSWSLTAASGLDVDNGDCFLGAFCSPSNASAGANWSANTLTIPGVTNAAATELAEPTTALGNALGGFILGRLTSTGPSTGNPTMTGTTVKGVKQRGPALFLRIRDVPAPDNGGDMMQFFGMHHNDDELARRRYDRRASGLYAPKPRVLARAA